jgi:hypothetical protein
MALWRGNGRDFRQKHTHGNRPSAEIQALCGNVSLSIENISIEKMQAGKQIPFGFEADVCQ